MYACEVEAALLSVLRLLAWVAVLNRLTGRGVRVRRDLGVVITSQPTQVGLPLGQLNIAVRQGDQW